MSNRPKFVTSGNQEGAFGWIAYNYLKKVVGPKKAKDANGNGILPYAVVEVQFLYINKVYTNFTGRNIFFIRLVERAHKSHSLYHHAMQAKSLLNIDTRLQ